MVLGNCKNTETLRKYFIYSLKEIQTFAVVFKYCHRGQNSQLPSKIDWKHKLAG